MARSGYLGQRAARSCTAFMTPIMARCACAYTLGPFAVFPLAGCRCSVVMAAAEGEMVFVSKPAALRWADLLSKAEGTCCTAWVVWSCCGCKNLDTHKSPCHELRNILCPLSWPLHVLSWLCSAPSPRARMVVPGTSIPWIVCRLSMLAAGDGYPGHSGQQQHRQRRSGRHSAGVAGRQSPAEPFPPGFTARAQGDLLPDTMRPEVSMAGWLSVELCASWRHTARLGRAGLPCACLWSHASWGRARGCTEKWHVHQLLTLYGILQMAV